MASVRDLLRVRGPLDLRAVDTSATPAAPGGKAETKAAFDADAERLFELGERLLAQGAREDAPRVLVVLQGMDASGKGGAVKRVGGQLNPQLVRYAPFGPPTEEERAHHFLWRVRRRVPPPARLGFFDRSHYEDVLVPRVRGLLPADVLDARYAEINAFERELADRGVRLLKVLLHISRGEQLDRMAQRLEKPRKRWKFDTGDLEEHERWDAHMDAHAVALERCSTDAAPWHVLPADRRWYRNWALQQLLCETLEDLGLDWPDRPDLDIPELRRRLDALR